MFFSSQFSHKTTATPIGWPSLTHADNSAIDSRNFLADNLANKPYSDMNLPPLPMRLVSVL